MMTQGYGRAPSGALLGAVTTRRAVRTGARARCDGRERRFRARTSSGVRTRDDSGRV